MSSDLINGGLLASAAVDRFFRRVLEDPTLAGGFDGQEIHRLAAPQQAFLLLGREPVDLLTVEAARESWVLEDSPEESVHRGAG